MKVREILSPSEIKALRRKNATNDEIIAIARNKRDNLNIQNNQPQKPIQTEAQKKEYDYLMNSDETFPSILRGMTKTGQRVVSAADWVSEKVGLDLIDDNSTLGKGINDLGNELDKKKEEVSLSGIHQEIKDLENKKGRTSLEVAELRKLKKRIKNKKQLQEDGANAEGVIENVAAGVKTMVDQMTHPEEWTAQGVTEFFVDPLNAVSFGTGAVVSKVARKLTQKIAIGGTGGFIEGASVNSAFEYAVAKGENKSDKEASNIAIQSAAGGGAAGSVFGAVGGATTRTKSPKLEGKSVKDILDNDLLKVDDTFNIDVKPDEPIPNKTIDPKYAQGEILIQDYKPDFKVVYDNLPVVLSPDDISNIMNKSFEVDNKYKSGDILETQKVNEPNFRMVYENLPAKLNELVETQIIDEPLAKQIEYKNKLILVGHEDVIYSDLKGWSERVSQDIVDASYAKKMQDIQKAESLSNEYLANADQIQTELISAEATPAQIKDTVNQRLIPTKEELSITSTLNSGMPMENRFTGARVRVLLENSIAAQNKTPDEFMATIKRAGATDEFAKVLTQSYMNKSLDMFDDFLSEKLTTKITEETKLLKQNLNETIIKGADDARARIDELNKRADESRGQDANSKQDSKAREQDSTKLEQKENESNQNSNEALHNDSGDNIQDSNAQKDTKSSNEDGTADTKSESNKVVQGEKSILDRDKKTEVLEKEIQGIEENLNQLLAEQKEAENANILPHMQKKSQKRIEEINQQIIEKKYEKSMKNFEEC